MDLLLKQVGPVFVAHDWVCQVPQHRFFLSVTHFTPVSASWVSVIALDAVDRVVSETRVPLLLWDFGLGISQPGNLQGAVRVSLFLLLYSSTRNFQSLCP